MKIAIIVPTIREDRIEAFKKAWLPQIQKYQAQLFVVHDGKDQYVEMSINFPSKISKKEILGSLRNTNLISCFTDSCRNLGFLAAKKYIDPDIYISLDDDVLPDGDTIGKHIEALGAKLSTSWISTLANIPVRGIPYGVRHEAPVMLSHGVWKGVPDLDAPSQLVNGIPRDYLPSQGVIPRGIYFPLCAMNFAFKREALPYAYQAPMNTHGFDRFADIWCGIYLKREFDKRGWAIYTGHASVIHERASNVFTNLRKEAKGIEFNELVWQGDEVALAKADPYFKVYKKCREEWITFIKTL